MGIAIRHYLPIRSIWILAQEVAPGNRILNDTANWNTDYSHISSVKVKTLSTDWDLWLCETNDFDKTALTTRQLASHRNGDYDITVDREYTSDNDSVYIIYADNTGLVNSASLYIIGEERYH